MPALYNEIEPFAAQWLRNLITAGHIANGVVDERSIADLTPDDVAGPGQRHFFAGIGGWSYALRLAGVPDDVSIWTGSCPCQPFSQAGAGLGFDDPRHLWPTWFALIRECRPPIVFGEQVAGPDGLAWLDVVFADLEGCGYACGAAVISAGGVGAPHGRHRLYFVALSDGRGRRTIGQPGLGGEMGCRINTAVPTEIEDASLSIELAYADDRDERQPVHVLERRPQREMPDADGRGADCAVADTNGSRRQGRPSLSGTSQGSARGRNVPADISPESDPWRDCHWIDCADGKRRPIPVEPALFPLAHGVPNRVGLLRGSGNAIVPQAAVPFIVAALGAREAVTP